MPTGDTAAAQGASLGADETDTYSLGQPGGDRCSGIIERSGTSVEVHIVWIDEDGNDLNKEQVAAPNADTQGTWDVPCRQPKCRLEVSDPNSVSGSYTMGAHFR